ncbi:MAG: ADP-ribosylglycohydrolase family protein [Bacteroidota bacterium]
MIGAIIGDILGSSFERRNTKLENFPLFPPRTSFTDDSVLTIATAYAILNQKPYRETYQDFYKRYPRAGYGGRFQKWARLQHAKPYNSYGNGSAMRVSPIAFAFETEDEVLLHAKQSAEVSHNHLEGIKGAQAIALCIFYARQKQTKSFIQSEIEQRFSYSLQRSIDEIRKTYSFDVSCQGSVPEAIISFLEGNDFESTIRKAISIGGDSDTIACMAGGIAACYYGSIPESILKKGISYLDPFLKKTTQQFAETYPLLTENDRLLSYL